MKTFKIGDTVRCVRSQTVDHMVIDVGYGGTITHVSPCGSIAVDNLLSFGSTICSPDAFQLVEKAPTFNLKTSPWFIRVNNEEEFNIINEWLEINFGARLLSSYGKHIEYLTNTYLHGDLTHRVMWSTHTSKGTKEIKITFETKTTIESVEYPETRTQQEVAIEELEATIELAKQQILKLKEGK
jgi:hypothetical protein